MNRTLKIDEKELQDLVNNIVESFVNAMNSYPKEVNFESDITNFLNKIEELKEVHEDELLSKLYSEAVNKVISSIPLLMVKSNTLEKYKKEHIEIQVDKDFIFQKMESDRIKFIQSLGDKTIFQQFLLNGSDYLETYKNTFSYKTVLDLSFFNPEVFLPVALKDSIIKKFILNKREKENSRWKRTNYYSFSYRYIKHLMESVKEEYSNIPAKYKIKNLDELFKKYIDLTFINNKYELFSLIEQYGNFNDFREYLHKCSNEELYKFNDMLIIGIADAQNERKIMKNKHIINYNEAIICSRRIDKLKFFKYLCNDNSKSMFLKVFYDNMNIDDKTRQSIKKSIIADYQYNTLSQKCVKEFIEYLKNEQNEDNKLTM